MHWKTTALAVIAGLLLAAAAYAQGTGRSLDIQPGARENGMGAAGVALGGDPTGDTWWNPAALGFCKHMGGELTGAQLVPGLATDVYYSNAAGVFPLEGFGALGFDLVYLTYGTSDGYDPTGIFTGQFTSYEVSPALSYGVQLVPNLSVGATVKWIRIQLAPQSMQGVGTTVGFDLGGLFKVPVTVGSFKNGSVNLGVAVQNLGPSVAFINEDEASPLSRNVKSGLAVEGSAGKLFHLALAGDFNQSLVTPKFRTYNGGLEIGVGSPSSQDAAAAGLDAALMLRVGYYSDPLGNIGGITYGLGARLALFALDIAGIPQARDSGLDYVKKITLGIHAPNF